MKNILNCKFQNVYMCICLIVNDYLKTSTYIILVDNLSLGLWCLTPFSTIFQLYRGGQFSWLRKPEYREKPIDLAHVTDELFQIPVNAVLSTPRLSGIRTRKVSGNRH